MMSLVVLLSSMAQVNRKSCRRVLLSDESHRSSQERQFIDKPFALSLNPKISNPPAKDYPTLANRF